jgi:exodeoxyribonuclease VII large subunit
MNPSITLFELNQLVRRSIEQCLPDAYWIDAELSEVHENRNGICYVEFIQNDERNGKCVAKARGIIWQQNYGLLKHYFEDTTGQTFTSGIKVRVQVSITFHEVYGYSLNVLQIDPTYTLGDMALRRQQILRKLEQEGVINLNRELPFPLLPQRIAVISSDTAAGYGDFCNQLQQNERGFYFQTELFQAIMQGTQTEQSVLLALQKVDERIDEFDVLVIIRGGGSTSDLSSFDNYLIAASLAQFRLPVITGIGHERDETVLDRVACKSVKTPTAVAALLIDRVEEAYEHLWTMANGLYEKINTLLLIEQQRLYRLSTQIPTKVIEQIGQANTNLSTQKKDLQAAVYKYLTAESHQLMLYQTKIADASPLKILSKGYSITSCNGKVVKDASKLKQGDILVTNVQKGTLHSKVENTQS